MPPKNRKKKQLNVFFHPGTLPIMVGITALFTYALGWIWLENKYEKIGRDIKKLETERAVLERKCQTEQYQWARLKSPHNLENELERRGIEMGWPRKDQVIRISEEVLHAELEGPQHERLATDHKVPALNSPGG